MPANAGCAIFSLFLLPGRGIRIRRCVGLFLLLADCACLQANPLDDFLECVAVLVGQGSQPLVDGASRIPGFRAVLNLLFFLFRARKFLMQSLDLSLAASETLFDHAQ